MSVYIISNSLSTAGTEIKDYGLIDHHYPPHHASNASRIPSSRIPAASRPSRIAQSTQSQGNKIFLYLLNLLYSW